MSFIYIFDIDDIVHYLIFKNQSKSPLRIQKSLYFIYVYYQIDPDPSIKNELFDAKFEAWESGPVIRSVFEKMKNGFYDSEQNASESIKRIEAKCKFKDFFDEMIFEMKKSSEFTLLQLSKQDEVWKKANSINPFTVISNEEIIEEYKSRNA